MERTKLNLEPLNDCVLVDPDLPPAYHEYRKYTHIIVPEKYAHGPEDRPVFGVVKARGKDCKVEVSIGDRVVFGKWAGARVKWNDQEWIMVRDYDLLAVIING